MIWWLIIGLIGGVIGIANQILNDLQKDAAVERQRWENEYKAVEKQIYQLDKQIDKKVRDAKYCIDFYQLTNLHYESVQIANHAYKLLQDSRHALAAVGNAIVQSSKEKNRLIDEKRAIFFNPKRSNDLEIEIRSLVELNRHLYEDKDQLKNQRDHFHKTVQEFNLRAHNLKLTIRDKCQGQGKDWYDRLEKRTFIREENKLRVQRGLPEIALPKEKQVPQKSRIYGTVKWFDSKKGFGFISADGGQGDVHVAKSNLIGVLTLTKDDRVEFEKVRGEKGPWAKDVRKKSS